MKNTTVSRGRNLFHQAVTWLVCVACLLPVAPAQATDGSWTSTTGGDYTNAANWNGGAIPDASGIAYFGPTNTFTVNLTAPAWTNNGLTFWPVAGTDTINLNGNTLVFSSTGESYLQGGSGLANTNTLTFINGSLSMPFNTSARLGGGDHPVDSFAISTLNFTNVIFNANYWYVGGNGTHVGLGMWNLYNSTATVSTLWIASSNGRTDDSGTGILFVANGSLLTVTNVINVGAYGGNGGISGYITVSNATFNALNGITLGQSYTNARGSLTIMAGGVVKVGGVLRSGNGSSTIGKVLMTPGGLLEFSSIHVFGNAGCVVSNIGGVFQFTNAAPTITSDTFGNFSITNGTVSFRAITNADVTCNQGVKALRSDTVMSWTGTSNTFRLNNATNSGTIDQTYTFAPGTATNFARLELMNGSTYRNGNVTIGANGSLYLSSGASTISSVLTAAPLSTIEFDLSNTNSPGCLLSTTNLYLNGCSLQLDLANPPILNTQFLIISNTLASQLSYSFAGGSTRQTFTINGTNYLTTIALAGGGTEVLVKTTIPARGTTAFFR